MANVTKRGRKYIVRWWALDGTHPQRSCPDRRTAEKLKREIETELALGRDWQPEVTGSVPGIEDIFEAYVEHRALRLRPRTLHRYGENLDLFVLFLREGRPRGKLATTTLSLHMLEDFYQWLRRSENGLHGRKREPDTARKIVEVVQLAWAWAEGSERWDGDIPRPRRIEMARSVPRAVLSPKWSEMDACVLASRSWYVELTTFLRYTGLREGESMLLHWPDVNLDEATISISPEISKTGRGRIIPISKHLVDVLSGWGVREGWLIPSGRKQGERYRQARADKVNGAWERSGVRPEAWKRNPTRAFRKGWKSAMLGMGANADAVDYLQGHVLGRGSRGRYIDPWQALPLRETVELIPKIGEAGTVVVKMPSKAKRG